VLIEILIKIRQDTSVTTNAKVFCNVVINVLLNVENAVKTSSIQHASKTVEEFLFVAISAKKNAVINA
jgi:hypothetical protein